MATSGSNREKLLKEPALDRYRYGADYFGDLSTFVRRIEARTIIPHQVEWQPAPPAGEICWLKCPYCYGGSANFVSDRLPLDRATALIHEMYDGGVRKIIFAGYATDPLFSRDTTRLVEDAVNLGMIVGFNTKALRIPNGLLDSLRVAVDQSYVSVSVDAGSNIVYNKVHGVSGTPVLYDRVLDNVTTLTETGIEVAATYLVNRFNANTEEVKSFLCDFTNAGCTVIRFTFAQLPRGESSAMPTVPTLDECRVFTEQLRPIIKTWNCDDCHVMLVDADSEHQLFRKPRTVPCVARWVYPTVGYDGWLYPCSQTGAPNFRRLALGNLATKSFWELYYNYDGDNLRRWMQIEADIMNDVGCRCDRKEHIVNAQVAIKEGWK